MEQQIEMYRFGRLLFTPFVEDCKQIANFLLKMTVREDRVSDSPCETGSDRVCRNARPRASIPGGKLLTVVTAFLSLRAENLSGKGGTRDLFWSLGAGPTHLPTACQTL